MTRLRSFRMFRRLPWAAALLVTTGAVTTIFPAAAAPAKQATPATVPEQAAPQHSPSTASAAADPIATPAIPKADTKAVLPDAAAGAAAANPVTTWPQAEIAAAKTRCAVILKRINAVAIEEAPIKEGACGTPAPIELISIGKNPQVSISPPATLTCEMAEALSTWMENDLQPLAKKHLGAEIITVETMSSYSCRNAYGRSKNKLSEHGVANALDIRGFVTATAKTAYVLEDWGTPQREILARIAAEKVAEEKAAAVRVAAEKAAQANQLAANGKGAAASVVLSTPPSATASSLGAPAAGIARSTIADGISKLTVTIPGARPSDASATGFAIGEPNRLGGPKTLPFPLIATPAALKAQEPEITAANKTAFLHAAHNAACQIFGTTLGPEANAEHRNHFHVDMAERRVKKICD